MIRPPVDHAASSDLGSRLLAAALVNRSVLEETLRDMPKGSSLAAALVERGVDENALVGFFVAAGHGPAVDLDRLLRAETTTIALLSAELAGRLMACPVCRTERGLLVALADPSDEAAIAEIRQAIGTPVHPAPARVSDLSHALARLYADSRQALVPVGRNLQPVEDESVSRVPREMLPQPIPRPSELAAKAPRRTTGPPPSDPAEPIQLVTKKHRDSRDHPTRRESERDPPIDIFSDRPAAFGARTLGSSSLPASGPFAHHGSPDSSFDMGDAEDRWSNLQLRTSPSNHPRPAARRLALDFGPTAIRDDEAWHFERDGVAGLATLVGALGTCGDRDELVDLTCEAGAMIGRVGLLLAVRRGILTGVGVKGGGMTKEAARALWIPVTSPSVFRRVVDEGVPFWGRHGPTIADQMFRATIGSRGGELAAWPVKAASRTMAILVVDEPPPEAMYAEPIEAVAHACGRAFERLMLKRKRDDQI